MIVNYTTEVYDGNIIPDYKIQTKMLAYANDNRIVSGCTGSLSGSSFTLTGGSIFINGGPLDITTSSINMNDGDIVYLRFNPTSTAANLELLTNVSYNKKTDIKLYQRVGSDLIDLKPSIGNISSDNVTVPGQGDLTTKLNTMDAEIDTKANTVHNQAATTITYDNAASPEINATNVQTAIDELNNRVDVVSGGSGSNVIGLDGVFNSGTMDIQTTLVQTGLTDIVDVVNIAHNHTANVVTYDNTNSPELIASDVQTAIDALNDRVTTGGGGGSDVTTFTNTYNNTTNVLHTVLTQNGLPDIVEDVDISHNHDANIINYDNALSPDLIATNVQTAIDVLNDKVDNIVISGGGSDVTAIDNTFNSGSMVMNTTLTQSGGLPNITDTVDISHNHAATEITYNNVTSGLVANETQGAIDELKTIIDTSTGGGGEVIFKTKYLTNGIDIELTNIGSSITTYKQMVNLLSDGITADMYLVSLDALTPIINYYKNPSNGDYNRIVFLDFYKDMTSVATRGTITKLPIIWSEKDYTGDGYSNSETLTFLCNYYQYTYPAKEMLSSMMYASPDYFYLYKDILFSENNVVQTYESKMLAEIALDDTSPGLIPYKKVLGVDIFTYDNYKKYLYNGVRFTLSTSSDSIIAVADRNSAIYFSNANDSGLRNFMSINNIIIDDGANPYETLLDDGILYNNGTPSIEDFVWSGLDHEVIAYTTKTDVPVYLWATLTHPNNGLDVSTFKYNAGLLAGIS